MNQGRPRDNTGLTLIEVSSHLCLTAGWATLGLGATCLLSARWCAASFPGYYILGLVSIASGTALQWGLSSGPGDFVSRLFGVLWGASACASWHPSRGRC